MNIFEIQQSKDDRIFLKENLSKEFEVVVDIAPIAAKLPYLGSLFKIGEVAINLMNWKFAQKIGKFLQQIDDLSETQIEQYLSNLSDKDYSRISDYLLHLLYNADEESKVTLMGKIYKARILNIIDNDMMLRLCSIVQRAYFPDLIELASYTSSRVDKNYVTDNLFSMGLLSVDSGGVENNILRIGTSYTLNSIGELLLSIINL